MAWFSYPPLFDAFTLEKPLEFLEESYPTKTRGMGLPYGGNFMILYWTIFDWSTHVTDGRTSIQHAKHICYMLSCAKNVTPKI